MSIWSKIVAGIEQRVIEPKKPVSDIPSTHKRCTLCKQVKYKSEFYAKTSKSINALSSHCKDCMKVKGKAYYQKKKSAEVKK